MSGIKGIGGIFIYAKDPESLAAWYRDVFGIDWIHYEPYNTRYKEFKSKEIDTDEVYSIAWSILPYKGEKREGQQFCINYRVDDLSSFVETLRSKGAEVKDVQDYPEGKFSSLMDPEGNKIELWQAAADFSKEK
jgi:glyoxylase I family protein